MTFISDLTARAISFITAVQTALVNAEIETLNSFEKKSILTIAQNAEPEKEFTRIFQDSKLKEKFTERATELVWISNRPINKEIALDYAIKLCTNLVGWISFNRQNGITGLQKTYGGFPTPYYWRIAIDKILYENPAERITLAIALQYLPIQIILALGGGDFEVDEQRILQIWNPTNDDWKTLVKLLNKERALLLFPEDKEWKKLLYTAYQEKDALYYPNNFKSKIILQGEEEEWEKWLKPKEEEWENLLNSLRNPIKRNLIKEFIEWLSITMRITSKKNLPNGFKELEKSASIKAIDLLQNQSELITQLLNQRAPLTFELVFSEELNEIKKNRDKRWEEENITASPKAAFNDTKVKIKNVAAVTESFTDRIDPFERAQKMGILALALSGGGIRSATFNLGILQGFADENLVGKFDYLSTVSGGGYIGSWLTTWIKRNESVVKVSNRLSTQTSPDPSGAELKPIKWLRMYSNYFAPNASIMSVDSWTVGITWLRNTLLNQVVIFLLFLSLLFAGNLFYHIWSTYLIHDLSPSWQQVLGWSILFLVPVALLSGLGMRSYNKEKFWWWNVRGKNSTSISKWIIIIAFTGAYFISAWLASCFRVENLEASLLEKIIFFAPAAVIAFACLMLVAYLGNYMELIRKFHNSRFNAFRILFLTTFLSAVIGWFCLALISVLLEKIPDRSFDVLNRYTIDKEKFQFILGVPLSLEVITLSIITRMGLLGKYFPDEKREWWGRIGANIHRISFLWMVVFSSALIGLTFIHYAFDQYAIPSITATGGWIALVGACVKAAFSAKTAGKGEENGTYSLFLKVLSMFGPYLFILGLLILLPGLLEPLLRLAGKVLNGHPLPVPAIILQNLLIMSVCAAAAFFLSRQLGVNEFSMYNFYKNRLVRAYLGGTRRSTERQKSANSYTGFDSSDDELLHTFCNEEGYHGPYQILNCALNASEGQELDRQDRKAESFIFSPLYCGFDFSMARAPTDKEKSYDYAFRRTNEYAFEGGPYIGTAMAISGAAINPNQGHHSSAPIAFLLTIFNAQMGRWLGNPRKSTWQNSDPKNGLGYMIIDLISKTTTRDYFISLSDGGHFDNMGLYEMVRRRCPYIILCDAEQDGEFTCEGFANSIRRCRIDFGAEITIDISKITERPDGKHSKAHYALGKIRYVGDNQTGVLLYIKSSIDGKEPVDVYEYALKNKTFPHQTTADQFFDEEQFETYRKLGLHIAEDILSDKEVIKAFKWENKKQTCGETFLDMTNPFQEVFTSIKNFFIKK